MLRGGCHEGRLNSIEARGDGGCHSAFLAFKTGDDLGLEVLLLPATLDGEQRVVEAPGHDEGNGEPRDGGVRKIDAALSRRDDQHKGGKFRQAQNQQRDA